MTAKKSQSTPKKKRSLDEIINESVAQQHSWRENRSNYARRFLKTLNIFARPAPVKEPAVEQKKTNVRTGLSAYWFPILCAFVVIFIAIWVAFVHTSTPRVVASPGAVPEPIVKTVEPINVPTFDIVRIEKGGNLVVAGRWNANAGVSILMNGKIVASEQTNVYGEFAYAPSNPLMPGNYTLSLLSADGIKSDENVFLYVSEHGYENSVSLLMTNDGSTLLQAPTMLADGDLAVSKIDYLSSGRVVVTGDALPRLRVSLALDNKYLGFARVSDHKHFGLGADVGELESGKKYVLTIRLHDGDGRTVAQVGHKFTMPEMTGDDDTFYTVRRGDCLWVIARNFLRRGILFSIIADRNNIANPDLIFPNQTFSIPVDGK